MKLIGYQKAINLFRIFLTGIFLAIFWFGCGSMGKNFDESLYTKIAKGTTNKNDIKAMFGNPFKKESKMDPLFGPTNITMLTPLVPILSRI